jgi:glycerol-3-phosphate acyltransferase PlsY
VAAAVVAGHIWPAQLRFRGGKGIATAMGAVPTAMPWLSLHLLVVALAALLVTRRTHWAGVAAVVVLVPFARGLGLSAWATGGFVATAMVVLWAHRVELSQVVRRRVGHAPHAAVAPR